MFLSFCKFAQNTDKAVAAAAETLRQKIATEEAGYQREMKSCCGFSSDDARKEYADKIRAAIDGKHSSEELMSRREIMDRNARVRRIAKERAARHGKAACELVADFFETLKKHVPAYAETMLASERAIFKNGGSKSPLALLCEALPAKIDFQINNLRERTGRHTRPLSLIEGI